MPDLAAELARRGCATAPGLLPPPLCAEARRAADRCYAAIDAALIARGPWSVAAAPPPPVPPGARYVPTAASLTLDALGPLAAAIAEAVDARLAPLAAALGPLRRLTDQGWLRRQVPPARARPPHAPHGWHQDGGLGFDYLAGDPSSADALLPMLTAWIPLVDCGVDAPGLRLDPTRREALIPLDRLAPEAAAAAPRLFTPALRAGDGLLMHGGTLHATAPVGHAERISVELRWLPVSHPGR